MQQDLLFGRLHPDLACAIALSIVEDPRVIANAEAISLHDQAGQLLGCIRDWLQEGDPLHQATREYLLARREASQTTVRRPWQSSWAAASAARVRDAANNRALQAKDRARALLAERGVLTHARQAGLTLLGVS
jgi:hypothetical protein